MRLLTAVAMTSVVACTGPGRAPGDATDQRRAQRTTPPPVTAPPPGHCPNGDRVLVEGEPLGGTSKADVTGDGEPDRVFLVQDPGGEPDCRNFLVLETEGAKVAAPTSEEGVAYALETPRINAFAQIDGEAGEEVLVDLEQGASTQFIGIFTVSGGQLQRVEVRENTDFGSLFPYGGSVGHFEASNCPDHPEADVSLSIATANATDYTIRTRLYEMNGAALVPLPRAEQPPIVSGKDLDRIEGFATSPFGDCPREGAP